MYFTRFSDLVEMVQTLTRDKTISMSDVAAYCDIVNRDIEKENIPFDKYFFLNLIQVRAGAEIHSILYPLKSLTVKEEYEPSYYNGWMFVYFSEATQTLYSIYIPEFDVIAFVLEYDTQTEEFIPPTKNETIFFDFFADDWVVLIPKVKSIEDIIYKDYHSVYVYGASYYNALLNNSPEAPLWGQKYREELSKLITDYYFNKNNGFDYINKEIGSI